MARILCTLALLATSLLPAGCAMCDSCYPHGPVVDGNGYPGRAGSAFAQGAVTEQAPPVFAEPDNAATSEASR